MIDAYLSRRWTLRELATGQSSQPFRYSEVKAELGRRFGKPYWECLIDELGERVVAVKRSLRTFVRRERGGWS